MTALLVIELADKQPEVLDEMIQFSMRADTTMGSTSDLIAGEQVTVGELLYGLMLPSGNDASVAFAEHFGDRMRPDSQGPGGYAGFVAAMNRRAQQLGLQQTRYANPHGLTNTAHRSSASDLARLARHALKQPLFQKIVSTREHETTVESIRGYTRMVRWKNTNRLLELQGYNGVKTGYDRYSGSLLGVEWTARGSTLDRGGSGAKSSESRYTETRNLFRWACKSWRRA